MQFHMGCQLSLQRLLHRPHGPRAAWGNSLFEDNAEYGFGMLVSMKQRRARVEMMVRDMIDSDKTMPYLKAPLQAWYDAKDDPELSASTASQLVAMLSPVRDAAPQYAELLECADMLAVNRYGP